MFKKALFLSSCLLLCGRYSAAIEISDRQTYALPSQWQTKSYLEFYLSDGIFRPPESSLNPGNRIFGLPSSSWGSDVRENFSTAYGNLFKFVLRPRYQSFQTETRIKNLPPVKTWTNKLDLTDAFFELRPQTSVGVTVGVQVYQWGPAELLNPSNPVFHFNLSQKSFFYKEKGHALVRVSYLRDDSSLMFISEPVSNTDRYWIEGKKFSPQNFIKYEKNQSPTDYFGAVAGVQEANRPFVGGYITHALNEDGFSFYFDGRITKNALSYVPVENGSGGYDLSESEFQKSVPVVLYDLGARYEGNFDFRIEYIYNSVGYGHGQLESALSAIAPSNPNFQMNLARFRASGMELIGQSYLYTSIRKVDFAGFKDFNFFGRMLFSIQDYSANLQIDLDKALNDYFVMYFEASSGVGGAGKEMTLTLGQQYYLGLKFVL